MNTLNPTQYQFSNETITNATRALDVAYYAKLVKTLVTLGRPLNRAIMDVSSSYALSVKQVKAIVALVGEK